MATVKHAKTNSIPNWTQTDVDQLIAQGVLPPGTTIANITLAQDWNTDHLVSNIVNADISASANIALSKTNISLTTTGSSGAATINTATGVLNIPNYAGGSGGTPGGSTTQLQYNNAGAFGGLARVTGNGNDISFVSQAAPTYSAGKLVYDADNECLTFFNNDSNVSLQIGQEEWVRVKNVTGATIANGAALYLNGINAGIYTVGLAQSNAGATTICVGLATESIANNAIGYVARGGTVNNLDTSSFTAGQTVYLSSTVAGGLTTTAPLAPNYRYRVGIVGVVSATVGTIYVTASTAALGNGTVGQVISINGSGLQEYKTITESIGFTVDGGGVAIPTGKVRGFFTSPYSGTISGWAIVADTGTVTVKVWKIGTGTAKPTAANSINTSGVSLTTGTAIRSTTLTDFTNTAVSAFDIFAYNIEAVTGVTELTFNLFINRL